MIDTKKYQEMVQGPGAFEGEPPEVAYFYDLALEGQGEKFFEADIDPEWPENFEDVGIVFTMFYVDADESDAFDLNIDNIITIWEDSQGFVFHRTTENTEQAKKEAAEWLGINID